MPEIGATLREARMRARIDISEIESETKIRAKYLRALENEEWGLLPGPAYVRSFLRTYAEALDLDAKLLLEEYKLRHERPSDHDLMPIGAPRRHPRGRQPRGVPRWLVVAVVVVCLLGALYALGKLGGGGGGSAATTTPPKPGRTTTTAVPPSTTARAQTTPARKARRKTPASARLVRLQIVPTGPGPVFVCVADAGGRLRIPGVSLQQGAATGIYRSRAFKVRLGNGNAAIRANGKSYKAANASPIGYSVTRKAVRQIPVSQTPTCVR
jgi:transcriptional regulator with XRE-family HTH domain